MAPPPSSTAVRAVLWGTTGLVVAFIGFVALVPGPELPAVYGDFSAIHDSLVRSAASSSPSEDGLLGRVEASVGAEMVTIWLYRHEGSMVSVHRMSEMPPRPRGSGSPAGLPAGSFAFDRGDLLFLVSEPDGQPTVLVGYASILSLRSMLRRVILEGPGPAAVPAITPSPLRESLPRPSGPSVEPPTR